LTSGEDREVDLLVMAWGASQFIYAEGQESQRLPDWMMGHRRGMSISVALHTLKWTTTSRAL